jgi:hypothetical protein
VFFLEGVPDGEVSVAFDLVASAPCRVTLPAAWAAPMYQPEAFGRGLPVRMLVQGVPSSPSPEAKPGSASWADEAWVGRMLDFASKAVKPPRAGIVARSLAAGESLRAMLVRELLAEGSEEAVRLAAEGLVARPLPAGAADPDRALLEESDRRAGLLEECVRSARGPGNSAALAVLLRNVLGDGSFLAIHEAMRGGAGMPLKASTVLRAVRAEQALRARAASAMPWGAGPGEVPAAPTFRRVAEALAPRVKGNPAHGERAFLDWVLADPGLFGESGAVSLRDLRRFLVHELGIKTDLSPLVPEVLLEKPLPAAPEETVPFGDSLRAAFSRIGLTVEASGPGGLAIVPLGLRAGLDEAAVKASLEDMAEKWRAEKAEKR